MKTSIALGIALSLNTLGASAQTAVAPVSGSFWEDGTMRAHFDLKVGPGETQRLPLSGDRSIEVARSGTDGPTVRLLDSKGQELQSAALGDGTSERSVRIAICGANITISSPENASDPLCSKP